MPKKAKYSVAKTLDSLDLFEGNIHMNMGGSYTFGTSVGGILSLIIVLFLISQAVLKILDITNRKNPNVLQMNEFQLDPKPLALNSANNFIFAVALSKDNKIINLANDSFASFTATFTQQKRSIDGSITKLRAKFQWAPCTQDRFPSNVFDPSIFSAFSLKNAYCPTGINYLDTTTGICPSEIAKNFPNCITPLDFSIQGTYLSEIFEYVQFKLHLCDTADKPYIQNLECTTADKTSFFTNSEVKLNLFFSNTLLDPFSYQAPNTSYIDSLYWNVDPSTSKVADIFIDTVTVQDFGDYYYTDVYHNHSYYTIQTDKVREIQAFSGSGLLEWNFRRSASNLLIARKYVKILDVLSSIGGMSKILLVIGAFIAYGYAKYKSQMILCNKLYNFESLEKKKNKKKKQKKKHSSLRQKEHNATKAGAFFNVELPQTRKTNNSQHDHTVKSYFETQRKATRGLDYGELKYFKGVLRSLCCCKPSPEEILARKAMQQVNKDLDVVKIVEKLKEVDRLKRLLFNKSQRAAFNFIEKPRITVKDNKPIEPDSLEYIELPDESPTKTLKETQTLNDSPEKNEKGEHISKYQRLYQAYLILKEDNDPRNWKFNNKLLKMLGEDLKVVFKRVDDFMEGPPDPEKFGEIVKKIVAKAQLLEENEDQTPENVV